MGNVSASRLGRVDSLSVRKKDFLCGKLGRGVFGAEATAGVASASETDVAFMGLPLIVRINADGCGTGTVRLLLQMFTGPSAMTAGSFARAASLVPVMGSGELVLDVAATAAWT